MKRATIGALFGCLLLGTWGCCNPCCSGYNRMGCGKPYISDWYDSVGCDPCDKCGNWTGSCGGCSRPWLDHWRFGCGGWFFPGLYGGAYGSRCQRCCGGPCGGGDVYDDGYHGPDDGYHGDFSGSQGGEVIYDGPVRNRPSGPTVAPDSTAPLPPGSPSSSSQQNDRQWRSLKTNR